MITENEYIRRSIALHLFFARIIGEHMDLLTLVLSGEGERYMDIANAFNRDFNQTLSDSLDLANGNVDENYLNSKAIVTNYTMDVEKKTETLGRVKLRTMLTERALNLVAGEKPFSEELKIKIDKINDKVSDDIKRLLSFFSELFANLSTGKLFVYNYPDLIRHHIKEILMYQNDLRRLMEKVDIDPTYVYETEYKLDEIMKEHGQFIKGLVNPTETDIINRSQTFIDNYQNILEMYKGLTPDILNMITLRNIELTNEFEMFKTIITEDTIKDRLFLLIYPLFGDHILREASYFLYILKLYKREA